MAIYFAKKRTSLCNIFSYELYTLKVSCTMIAWKSSTICGFNSVAGEARKSRFLALFEYLVFCSRE